MRESPSGFGGGERKKEKGFCGGEDARKIFI
jgi:hypothetical protein